MGWGRRTHGSGVGNGMLDCGLSKAVKRLDVSRKVRVVELANAADALKSLHTRLGVRRLAALAHVLQ